MSIQDNKGKHLTLDDRINILNDLAKGDSLANIAAKLGKDPTTISKEIRLHRYSKEKGSFNGTTSCHGCANLRLCTRAKACGSETCRKYCKSCRAFNVSSECADFKKAECKTVNRFPYTCHHCGKKASCKLTRYFYDPNIAEKEYKETLSEARSGLNMRQSEFDELDRIVSDGIRKGKSVYSILLNNPDILKSGRTIYRYIGHSYFQIKDVDLRNKVKMKPRKAYSYGLSKDKAVHKKETILPRNYDAYLRFVAERRTSDIPQFDLVQGSRGNGEPYLMTFIFPFSNLMIAFLVPTKEQEEITKVFDRLEGMLGKDDFRMLFPACLTDRGNEFLDAEGIEHSPNGSKRTSVFYCDPYSSSEKVEIERNHEFFRFYSPKAKSLKEYTQDEIDLMFSHINSYNRKAKDGKTPYQIFEFIYGKDMLDRLNMRKIDYDDIDLTRNLLIKYRANKKA